MDVSPFHADERTAQRRAGGGMTAANIRDRMPEQHRAFFSALSYVAVAAVPADGWPVATMLTGDPGFVQTPDAATLHIDLPSGPLDPTAEALARGQEIGVLGIDLATRRRNRANGRLMALDASGMTIAVRQSFGNCPQYIQRRLIRPVLRPTAGTERLASPDAAARALIAHADTFFIASRSGPGIGERGGADISHRGGRPGFARLRDDVLSIPDFHGNRYFNTLGNLIGEPRAALLFVDFEQGDLLHLQGEAEIDWSADAAHEIEGAERCWRFRIRHVWRRRGALPLAWDFVDQAPTTARTGIWRPAG